jgi:hypothetical protein
MSFFGFLQASPLVVTTPLVQCNLTSCTPYLSPLQKEILLNSEVGLSFFHSIQSRQCIPFSAQVIAINQDVTPQGRPIVDGDLTVWARMLSDGSVAVALYNQEDEPMDIGFQFSQVRFQFVASFLCVN